MNSDCRVLAPVGSKDVLSSAVFSGADYVYLSGTSYGARDFADNFNYDEMIDAITFCHRYNVKVFVTVNISILESEIVDVVDYVFFLYSHGVDAIIIQDLGLFSVLHDIFDKLELHASTQMTIYDYSFVKWLSDNGFDNVNLSREVPLERIRDIKSKLVKFDDDVKVEVFAHGALCYCFSGRCLMSSFLGGRSGNRGLCAQPCRMRYTLLDKYHGAISDDSYLISPKDLCTYNSIGDIVDSGVDSIKIEGRMKSKDYVASSVYSYKEAVEGNINDDNYLLLNLAFNRGFSDGYLLDNKPDDVIGRSRSGNKGYPIGVVDECTEDEITIRFIDRNYPTKIVNGDGLKFEYDKYSGGMYVSKIISQTDEYIVIANNKKMYIEKDSMVYITYSKFLNDKTKEIIHSKNIHKIKVSLDLTINDDRQLEVLCRSDVFENDVLFVSKEKFEKAQKRPLTKQTINQQLEKTGDSKYIITSINYTNFYDDLFMPLSVINNIRRGMIKKLDKQLNKKSIPDKKELEHIKERIKEFKSEHYKQHPQVDGDTKWNVYISSVKQAEILKDYDYINEIYYDASFNYENMDEYAQKVFDDIKSIHETLPDKTIVWILPQLLLDEDLPHISEIIVKIRFNDIPIKIQTDNIAIADNLDVESYLSNINIYNNYTIKKLEKEDVCQRAVISNEISLDDIKRLFSTKMELEYVVFGYLQLMISNDDFKDLTKDYETSHYYLKDKRNNEFMMKLDCNKHSHIYDYRVLNLKDKIDKLNDTNITNLSIDLRLFNKKDTENILKYFNDEIEDLELFEENKFFMGNIEKGLYKNNK